MDGLSLRRSRLRVSDPGVIGAVLVGFATQASRDAQRAGDPDQTELRGDALRSSVAPARTVEREDAARAHCLSPRRGDGACMAAAAKRLVGLDARLGGVARNRTHAQTETAAPSTRTATSGSPVVA